MNESPEARGAATTNASIRELVERMLTAAQTPARRSFDLNTLTKYFVLSTPRTGSTMFCVALERAGLGWPVEWFNPQYMQEAAALLGTPSLNMSEYVTSLLRGTANLESLTFGVNFHVQQYLFLKQQGVDLFDLGFKSGYYVYRRDKAKQAYSFAKSNKTGLWSREDEIAAGIVMPPKTEVTAAEFCNALNDIVSASAFAETALRARLKRTFSFEELFGGSLATALRFVLDDLGVAAGEVDGTIPTLQQSNAYDRENLTQILNDLGLTPNSAK